MKITEHKSPAQLEVKNALEFVKALKLGKDPEEAAMTVGEPLAKLMRSPEVLGRLEKLKDFYFAKAEERKALLIARMTEVLLTGDDRDSTAAARVLASDPDLGFQQQGPTIQITISEDIEKMDPGTPWDETQVIDIKETK